MKRHLWVILSFLTLFSFIFYVLGNKKRPDEKEKFLEENKELFDIIDNYTFQTPIPYMPGKNFPSNYVFFYPYKNDTVMSIVGTPYYLEDDTWWIRIIWHDKWWQNFIKDKKNVHYYTSAPDGIFWFSKKTPVIFFNTELYKSDFKTHLNPKIPDSLKRDPPFIYCGYKQWFYLYKNGKFIPIKLKRNQMWKGKPYYIVEKENSQDSILQQENNIFPDKYATNDTIKIIVKQNKISKILIPDKHIQDFTYLKYNDRAKIVNELYVSLLNMILKFEPDFQLKKISYRVNMRFKVFQYTTDNKPAYPLAYDNIILFGKTLETDKPYIKLPQPGFSNPKKHSAFAKIFNFDNDEQLIQSIEQKHLKNIKPLSIEKQKVEYKKILENIDD